MPQGVKLVVARMHEVILTSLATGFSQSIGQHGAETSRLSSNRLVVITRRTSCSIEKLDV